MDIRRHFPIVLTVALFATAACSLTADLPATPNPAAQTQTGKAHWWRPSRTITQPYTAEPSAIPSPTPTKTATLTPTPLPAGVRLRVEIPGGVYVAKFSPDGSALAVLNQHGISLYRPDGTDGRLVIPGSDDLCGMEFSPDGGTLATGVYDGHITLWDTATWEKKEILTQAFSSCGGTYFSNDGTTLTAVWGMDCGLHFEQWNWKTATRLGSSDLGTDPGSKVGISPDGRTLAYSLTDWNGVGLWDIRRGKKIRKLIGHEYYYIVALAFSPDGRKLVSSDWNTIIVWDVAAGKKLRILNDPSLPAILFAFSPDNRTVAAGMEDGRIAVWDSAGGDPPTMLTGLTDPIDQILFAPDGKTMVTPYGDDTLFFWDVPG